MVLQKPVALVSAGVRMSRALLRLSQHSPDLPWLLEAASLGSMLNQKPRPPATKDDFSRQGCLVLTAEAHLADYARRKSVKSEATQELTEFPENPAREMLVFKGHVGRKEAPHPTTKWVP